MNKILLSFCAVVIAFTSTAQTVPDAGMENWRSNSTGTTHAFTIYAPYSWYGFDSLLIADAELFSFVLHSGTKFHPQLFQESTIIHSGSSSAKVMTMRQDTLGLIPGSLSNASVTVNPAALLGGGSLASATKFNGGSPVNQRITTVSAWVQYLPGIDSVTGLWGGKDTARLTVQALGHIHGGNDTVVGIGGLQILPSTSFVQVTANLTYWDTAYLIDTIRIIFASSGGGASKALDSSTLYVDDVSLTGVPNPDYSLVKNISTNNFINVYPNPASGNLYFRTSGYAGMKAALYSINGQVVTEKYLTGYDAVDVSQLPSGLYFYSVFDKNGAIVQRGKVSVNN